MTYTLTVNAEEIQLIATALNELPRKLSQPLFAKLQEQVSAQENQARAKAEAEHEGELAASRVKGLREP